MIRRKFYILLAAIVLIVANVMPVMADSWSIDFTNKVTQDKVGITISNTVVTIGGTDMGTCSYEGGELDSKFVLQTKTTWMLRATAGLYQGNSGGRAMGLRDCTAGQIITIKGNGDPNPSTNATLKSIQNNTYVYTVTADGDVKFTPARYLYFTSITVEEPSAEAVSYTVKFVNGEGTEIKDAVTYEDEPGAAISILDRDKANIVYDGVNYIYQSDDAAGQTVAEDGSTVVTLVFREAAIFNYTVKAVDGSGNVIKELATGTSVEGTSATVYFPQYMLQGTSLSATAQKSPDWYGATFTPDADNYVYNVAYNSGTVENVVYYTEGEDVNGVNVANYTARASNGRMGYTAGAYVETTTLEPGKYKIYMRGLNGNSTGRAVSFKAGEDVVFNSSIPQGTNFLANSDEFAVPETASLSFSSEGSSSGGVDWFYVQRTGDIAEVTYTVNFMLNDGETQLKETETRTGYAGVKAEITEEDKAMFEADGVYYSYISDDSENNIVAADGSTVVTITYAVAEPLTYQIVAVDGDGNELAVVKEGQLYEGQNESVYYTKAVSSNGKWYMVAQNASDPYYGATVEAGQTLRLTYTETDATYFSEVEDLTPSRSWAADGAFPSRYANGQAKRLFRNSYVTTDAQTAGVYSVTLRARNNSGSSEGTLSVFLADASGAVTGEALATFTPWGRAQQAEMTVTGIAVPEGYKVAIFNTDPTYNSNLELDYIYLTRTGDIQPIEVTIGQYGYATLYYGNFNLEVPEGVTAYAVTVEKRKVTLLDVGDIISAGTAVVLEGAAGIHSFNVTSVAGAAVENDLKGTDVESIVNDEGYKYYMLSVKDAKPESVGFYYQVEDGVSITNNAHMAYLAVPVSSQNPSNAYRLFDVDGIKGIGAAGEETTATYTLSGVRVEGGILPKGVYVRDVKKVIIK